ncbi:hypothetical protein [Spiroplasma endosymbiont of Virgichneumon dumeticola]|uniref:hypothetical protein n=1 Tax=Spiroplasma endosymbiont of Virgichneumon dumeticola TaxID=3139323 RepID=UPI0035C8C3A3
MKKIKLLQLLTVIMLTLIVLITIIGIYLIGFSDFKDDDKSSPKRINGFATLSHLGISFIIGHSVKYICYVLNDKENYYNFVQLQIGVILCLIISPTLLYVTILFITFILVLKIISKNNNFWDAISNCQIINNYYVH